jgi:hypothetical protein
MLNVMKKVCFVLSVVFMLASCSEQEQVKYVPAKLVDSDLWSIVNVENGEVMYEDEFKSEPSMIVCDRFCVKNESGNYDYYSISDVRRPINSESYMLASAFCKEGVALVVKKGQPISIIDKNCKEVATLSKDIRYADNFSNGFSIIRDDDGKVGVIDTKGNVIVAPQYDHIHEYSEDKVAIAYKQVNDSVNQVFALNAKGEVLFSFKSNEYKDYTMFHNGYMFVQRDNEDLIALDKKGNKAFTLGKWNGYLPYQLGFYDGLIVFKDGDSYGLKNKDNKIVLRAKYDSLNPLSPTLKGLYLASKQNKYGVIDADDNIVIPFDYDVLAYVNDNCLINGGNKTFSFMDIKQKEVGMRNYINISYFRGQDIKSNFFNAKKEAKKMIANYSAESAFDTQGKHLRDYNRLLKGVYSSEYMHTLVDSHNYPFIHEYRFDKALSSQRYRYVYYFSIPTGLEYNYDANLMSVNTTYDLLDYDNVEEEFATEFESQIKLLGFEPKGVRGEGKAQLFEHPKTHNLMAVGYEDGHIRVMYSYNADYVNLPDRITQKNSIKEVVNDHQDALGFDDTEADSVEVVVEEIVEN